MRKTPKFLILPAAVAALAVLLLAGCYQGRHEENTAVEQVKTSTDSIEEEDTMAAFYERMWRMKVLLRGAGRWESDK